MMIGQLARTGHQSPRAGTSRSAEGASFRHLTDAAYADYCTSRVAGALAQHGLETEIRPPHLSPPNSRRRACFARTEGRGRGPDRVQRSRQQPHRRHGRVPCPRIHVCSRCCQPLRGLLATILPAKRTGDIQLTLTDQGPTSLLKGVEVVGLEAVEALTAFSEANRLARLSIDEGLGPEPRYRAAARDRHVRRCRGAATDRLLPPGHRGWRGRPGRRGPRGDRGASRIADLFAGLGTFALSLDGQITAAEASRDAVLALKSAAARSGRAVTAEHRDLYRRPYDAKELAAFDAVVLDPPRSGAQEQVKELAASAVATDRLCQLQPGNLRPRRGNPGRGRLHAHWARPVGQFRWSTHVELAAAFSR